jgi:hypothetical protein
MTEKTIAQKLLIKENNRLLLVNTPADLLPSLGPLPAGVTLLKDVDSQADAILLFVANQADLEQHLPGLKVRLAPKGMVWVFYYKLTSKKRGNINRDSINAYAKGLGLEGIAMISVDEDVSALRLKLVS